MIDFLKYLVTHIIILVYVNFQLIFFPDFSEIDKNQRKKIHNKIKN